MGMSLNSGGHITHGLKISMSGKWFNAIGYDVDKKSELIDYDNVEKLALQHKPKLIIAGGSAYSRVCLLYTSPSPRDATLSRMPSSA